MNSEYKKAKNALDIYEKKLEIFNRDNYQCVVCGESIYKYGTPQLAHIVAKTKTNIKKYGIKKIHDKGNLKSTCSLKCNAKVMKNFLEAKRIMESIGD